MMGQATTDAVTAARELAPELSARAVDSRAAAGRCLATSSSGRRGAGLFRLVTPRAPRRAGAASPPTIVEMVEELCRADGSAGWTIIIGNGSAFLAWLDPAVAADLPRPHPEPIGGGRVRADGPARPRDGDGKFALAGRWAFCSGSPHADLFFDGAFAGGDPAGLAAGRWCPPPRCG